MGTLASLFAKLMNTELPTGEKAVKRQTFSKGLSNIFLSDGRLKPGDEILMVDSKSLVGLTHPEAVGVLKNTQQLVQLVVATEVSEACRRREEFSGFCVATGIRRSEHYKFNGINF